MLDASPRALILIGIFLLGAGLSACGPSDALPDPASDDYREVVTAFYTGLAAMQVGEGVLAEERLEQVTEQAPGEPAAWANLGLLALRRNDFEVAEQRLERARDLAPDNSQISYFSGLLENARERPNEAAAYFRQAISQDASNARALYALAQLAEEQDAEGSGTEAGRLLDTLLAAQPNNLAVLLERARLATSQGDTEALQTYVARLAARAEAWPPDVREQMQALQDAASDAGQAATQIAFLQNMLVALPAYREDLAALQAPPGQVGEAVTRLIRLPSPSSQPAPPDVALAFAAESLSVGPGTDLEAGPWRWTGAVVLDDTALPVVVAANGQQVAIGDSTQLSFPGGPSAAPPSLHGVAGLDVNYDFLTDFALAGSGGLRLFQQDASEGFTDATAEMDLPATITEAAYTGVWGLDLDMEGDLDLVLAPSDGPPRVLRNNGDGTFSPWDLFGDVGDLRDLAWADLDADGDPDAALLDASGRLHVFENRRSQSFQEVVLPPAPGETLATTAADVDRDGIVDLIVLQADGTLRKLSWENGAWTSTSLAEGFAGATDATDPGTARLLAADLDSNGGLDLLAATAAGTQLWLSDQQGAFHPLSEPLDVRVFDAADLTGEGRLDLVGLSEDGQPVRLAGEGAEAYSTLSIRPRATTAVGDRRVNPFGIGGEVEVRSGLLYQKQPITGPIVYFGLGDRSEADVARIIWPNGDSQAEFGVESDQMISTRQRLKGSCPWVFAYDGSGMRFVTDFLWRSPLGLAINAQETAGIMTTEDWVKIGGDQLVPRDGVYDVRITAELWETHFFDHVALLVVDHPEETDVFVDERFAFPPPALAVHATAPPRPVAQAWDDQGRDVTDVLQARDERYLGNFQLGAYQGVAQDHYVEIELGEDVPASDSLWLLATGWIRPTDSSVNVALSQSSDPPPMGLSVEVPDGSGGWTVAKDGLGFPSGKAKTILIGLSDLGGPDAPRRLRLRTNMEIYWDAFAWTSALPETELRTQLLAPDVAELRYRGFSEVTEANRSSPELPHYSRLVGTAQTWRDLVGYHTRFGDVRELLAAVDDRYVIMNAGDEMAFRFPAPPPPPDGWIRDFVLVGDGWVKDGDYNTAFSTTVRPLPAHDQPSYTTPPGRLEEDPVYQRHQEDWQTYHTRYITPERFHKALRVE
ncbi:MAG: FG-GAP-like repeat-containing protein [Rhodothermales bacterium]